MRRKTSFLLLILILLTISPCLSWTWSGKVVSVADGDTITVLRDKELARIQLYGIDCPEGGQAFGKKAKQLTPRWSMGR